MCTTSAMSFTSKLLATCFAATASATHAVPFGDNGDLSSLSYPRQASNESSEWPYGPFSTKGRDIVNSKGEAVTWAGVNWPGSGETMVPEGLEWASVEDIMDQIKSVGFNFIRLYVRQNLLMKCAMLTLFGQDLRRPSYQRNLRQRQWFRCAAGSCHDSRLGHGERHQSHS